MGSKRSERVDLGLIELISGQKEPDLGLSGLGGGMYGRTDGRTDGWMEGRMDERTENLPILQALSPIGAAALLQPNFNPKTV